MKKIPLLLTVILLGAGVITAQFFGGGGGRRGGGRYNSDDLHNAREMSSGNPEGVPDRWTNAPGFEKDVFTFARVRCDRDSGGYGGFGRGRGGGGNWLTDAPDSDLNFSWRVSQLTSLKVDPDGRFIRLTDKELIDYPWIYMVEPGRLLLSDEEVAALRKYLLNGGALMADDFWGERQWRGFADQIKRVFPERPFVDLNTDHPIFHCVFDLKRPMSKLQTPNFNTGENSQYDGVTWEYHDGEECREMHVRAIFDDKGRIMVIATHNCDNGDGWEREGRYHYFFKEFSEKRAYPLGINIVFYLMTH